MTTSACGGSACIAGVSRDCGHGMFQLEGGATRSQTRRDTNFAIPGYSLFCHDTTANGKNKVFSVCGHLCGQNRSYATFSSQRKSSKRRCRKALRRFSLTRPGYSHGTPKSSAIPASLHPDIWFCGGVNLYMGRCAGDTACKATAWSIDSADGVCAGRCGGDNAYPTMFRGKKQQGAGRKSSPENLLHPVLRILKARFTFLRPLIRWKAQGL